MIHRENQLRSFKQDRAQRLSEANRVTRLSR